jgi:hypothetical protein
MFKSRDTSANDPPPASQVVPPTFGLSSFDLPRIFACAVELAEAVGSVAPSEWADVPVDIEGPASPHFER